MRPQFAKLYGTHLGPLDRCVGPLICQSTNRSSRDDKSG